MLSKFVIFSGLLAVALGAAVQQQNIDINPDGSFQWSYQTDDGSSQQQNGQQLPGPDGGQAVQGSAQWYDPEGGVHQLQYTADQNGYQPTSADVPVGPEIPAAILRALQWNAAHPEEEINN